MHAEQIIKRPILLTEKASQLRENHNQYVFAVKRTANKIQIRDAVEKLFSVKVESVRTANMRGKFRRMGRGHAKLQNWKKAVVTLKDGDDIQFFDEEEATEE